MIFQFNSHALQQLHQYSQYHTSLLPAWVLIGGLLQLQVLLLSMLQVHNTF